MRKNGSGKPERPAKSGGVTGILNGKKMNPRQFLKAAGIGGPGMAASAYVLGCAKPPETVTKTVTATPATTPTAAPPKPLATAVAPARQVFVPNANMMIIGDPNRCVGCRRCEIACTEYNEGRTQPSLARVKVNRNYLFGPAGAQPGSLNQEGIFGNHRVVQDTCRQCPHPVPCMDVCPNGAIELDPKTNARVVNQAKCTGCKTCQGACPWDMTTFDAEAKKASKCHLCGGDPQCVKACPTGALQYVSWKDRTKEIPARFAPVAIPLPDNVSATCASCHK